VIDVSDGCGTEERVISTSKAEEGLPAEFIDRMRTSLSFRYAHMQSTRIPSKQTATQLKGRVKDREIAEDTVSRKSISFRRPSFAQMPVGGKDYGTAVHIFMQHADLSSCDTEHAVKSQLDRCVASNLLTTEQAEMIDPGRIVGFIKSSFGRRLQEHTNILREFKFSLFVDAKEYYPDVDNERILLQGVVDCAMIDPDGIAVVDYKTDRITEEMLPDMILRYKDQIRAYQYALERIYNLPVKEVYLYFFSIGKLISI
jgi:ATP-dependent helicase/nuclease subunit A